MFSAPPRRETVDAMAATAERTEQQGQDAPYGAYAAIMGTFAGGLIVAVLPVPVAPRSVW